MVQLLDLPYVSLMKILRFIDLRSLDKLKQTNRRLKRFLDKNEHKLILRRINRMTIRRSENKIPERAHYIVEIRIEGVYKSVHKKTKWFIRDNTVFARVSADGEKSLVEINVRHWWQTNFACVFVRRLVIYEVFFNCPELKPLDEMITHQCIKLYGLVLHNAIQNEMNSRLLARILKTRWLRDLTVRERNPDMAQRLFEEDGVAEQLSTMTSVNYSQRRWPREWHQTYVRSPFPEFKHAVFEFPMMAEFSIGIRFNIETMKELIHGYLSGKYPFPTVGFYLALEYRDLDLLVKAIDLKFSTEISADQRYTDIIYIEEGNRMHKCVVRYIRKKYEEITQAAYYSVHIHEDEHYFDKEQMNEHVE